ncbi:MAG: hypothetical protein ACLTYH_07640 [Streptococcus salivarius]
MLKNSIGNVGQIFQVVRHSNSRLRQTQQHAGEKGTTVVVTYPADGSKR